MRLTCSPEPNLVGSKHSCSIDAFKHPPNHFLGLELHLKEKKKKWHNYFLVLERGHICVLNITSRIKCSYILALMEKIRQLSLFFFSCSFSVFIFAIVPSLLPTLKCTSLQFSCFPFLCRSLWCDVINCGVPGLAPPRTTLVGFSSLDERWLGIGYLWHAEGAWAPSDHDVDPLQLCLHRRKWWESATFPLLCIFHNCSL